MQSDEGDGRVLWELKEGHPRRGHDFRKDKTEEVSSALHVRDK